MRGGIAERECQHLVEMGPRVGESAKGELVQRHVFERWIELWIGRQGALEMLVGFGSAAGSGQRDPDQVAGAQVCWRVGKNALEARDGIRGIPLLDIGDRLLIRRDLGTDRHKDHESADQEATHSGMLIFILYS